jgi:hypothetical protein
MTNSCTAHCGGGRALFRRARRDTTPWGREQARYHVRTPARGQLRGYGAAEAGSSVQGSRPGLPR